MRHHPPRITLQKTRITLIIQQVLAEKVRIYFHLLQKVHSQTSSNKTIHRRMTGKTICVRRTIRRSAISRKIIRRSAQNNKQQNFAQNNKQENNPTSSNPVQQSPGSESQVQQVSEEKSQEQKTPERKETEPQLSDLEKTDTKKADPQKKEMADMEAADAKSKVYISQEERQKSREQDRAVNFRRTKDMTFFHKKQVDKGDILYLTVTRLNIYQILSVRLNGKECGWDREGSRIVLKDSPTQGKNKVEVRFFREDGQITGMEPWIFTCT